MDLFSRVRKLIEDRGIESEINPDSFLTEDLGLDSLDVIELISAFEEEFGIEIPDEDAEKLDRVEDIIRYLKERGIEG